MIESWQEIVVFLAVAGAGVYLVNRAIQRARRRRGACCDAGCEPAAGAPGPGKTGAGEARLIPTDQIRISARADEHA